MYWLCYLVMLVVPYLLGGINTSIIVMSLTTHKDIRQMGSGNAGLTNTLRTGGKAKAAVVLLGDAAKAVLAVFAVRLCFLYAADINTASAADGFKWVEYIACLMTVVGHVFPVYYGFKGGKGVLAAVSAILVLDWRIGLCLLGIFIIVLSISRYVSLSSIIAASFFCVGAAFFGIVVEKDELWLISFAFALMTESLVIFMHRSNIGRLVAGNEKKLSFKKSKEPEQNDK